MYTVQDVLTFVDEEDVKFVRLAFVDIYGRLKNIAIMPEELRRAFKEGIPFSSSNIAGFKDYVRSDLFLHPDPSTLSILPWRPSNGRVVRMFCNVTYPDGTPFEADSRAILQNAIKFAEENGINCTFGNETEFYLFKTDDEGNPTKEPLDYAGYLDVAPEDKGENVRRDICFTLYEMGIIPETSHHEAGPGQNEVDFRYSDPLTAAEDAITLRNVISSIAMRNGLYADFSPKPFDEHSGSGMHINISVHAMNGENRLREFMAGIIKHIEEITFFLNPTKESYRRFGEKRAPIYITWSSENRNQLIMIPERSEARRHLKLRSPDSRSNPYIAYALLIYAGLDGIVNKMDPGEPTNLDLVLSGNAPEELKKLPMTLEEAKVKAKNSEFVQKILGEEYLELF